jgi:hypothetical protein
MSSQAANDARGLGSIMRTLFASTFSGQVGSAREIHPPGQLAFRMLVEVDVNTVVIIDRRSGRL